MFKYGEEANIEAKDTVNVIVGGSGLPPAEGYRLVCDESAKANRVLDSGKILIGLCGVVSRKGEEIRKFKGQDEQMLVIPRLDLHRSAKKGSQFDFSINDRGYVKKIVPVVKKKKADDEEGE